MQKGRSCSCAPALFSYLLNQKGTALPSAPKRDCGTRGNVRKDYVGVVNVGGANQVLARRAGKAPRPFIMP